MKIFFVLALFFLGRSRFIHSSHEYWFTGGKKSAETKIPFTDVAWNYCDYKCLYLEQLEPNYDFFIVNFKGTSKIPDFSACYAQPK